MAPRPWGWWTEHKLDLLEKYLAAFTRASSRLASERIYLDLFAGQTENTSRETNQEIQGSVRRALSVEPPFTRVHLFELPAKARELEQDLTRRFPTQRPRVHPGDCNETVAEALNELRDVCWAPTFAFVDQQAAEVQWKALEQIARFRHGKTKAEMWILFGTSFLPRGLQLRGEHLNAAFGDRITDLFGSEQWVPIIKARRDHQLTPKETRFELVNLMRWRLENILGYAESHAFTMKNTSGHDLFDMIFVSDHPVGDKIMRHLYGKALSEHEVMRRKALEWRRLKRQHEIAERAGQYELFGITPDDVRPTADVDLNRVYQPEPPQEPYAS